MNKTVKKVLINLAYPVGIAGFLLIVWAIAAAAVNNYFILPDLGETARSFWAALGQAEFWAAFGGTLLRTLISFVISLIMGLGFAVLALLFPVARKILSPVTAFCRALPTLVIVLILAVWMPSQFVPVVVSLCIAFPMLYSGVLGAFNGVDRDLVEMSRVYGVPRKKMLTQLWIPSVMPVVLPVFGSTLSLLVKLMIAAEILASTASSLGSLISGANAFFDMGRVFALTLTAIIMAVTLEGIMTLIARRLTRWAR